MHISSHSFSRHPLKGKKNNTKSKRLRCTFHHRLQIKPLRKSEAAKQRQQKWRKHVIKAGWWRLRGWKVSAGGALRAGDVWNSQDGIKVNEWDNTRKWQGSKHIWKWKGYTAARKVHIFQSKDRWWNRWWRRWFKQLLSAVHQQWCNFLHRALVERPEDPNLPTSVS